MPWKLIEPHTRKDGKAITSYFVRGKYCGIRLNHSTGTGEEDAAERIFRSWKKQAEQGTFTPPRRKPQSEDRPLTFSRAATAYMNAGGDGSYLTPIMNAWPDKLAIAIDQVAIDTLADELYPIGTAGTRNRQVHTPISAVLKHVGIEKKLRRPKGWKGKKGTSWLEPDQAFAIFAAADNVEPEFGLFCRFLCYTGMRLGEALRIELRQLKLERAYVYLPDSKTGEPRGCHLPPFLVKALNEQPPRKDRPTVVTAVKKGHKGFIRGGRGVGRPVADAGVPFLERDGQARLFRYHAGGALRDMLADAMKKAGLTFPRRQGGFHIFCHTYGSWMHRYGNLDTHGLTRTGRWANADSADRYVHTGASEEAQRSNLLPVPSGGQVVDIKKGQA